MTGPLDTPDGGTMPVAEAKRRCVESCPTGSGPNSARTACSRTPRRSRAAPGSPYRHYSAGLENLMLVRRDPTGAVVVEDAGFQEDPEGILEDLAEDPGCRI